MTRKNDSERQKIVVAMAESQGTLYNYLFLRIGNDNDARDVLQQTNISIWQKIDTLDTPDHFLPWAKTLASFEVKTFLAKRRRDDAKVVFDSDAADAVAETLEAPAAEQPQFDEIDYRLLKECLGKLPPEKKRMVNQRYWEGRSVEKIAAEEKTRYSTVAMQLLRARKALGDCIRRLRCRIGEEPLPTSAEKARAKLIECALEGDSSCRGEWSGAVRDDSAFRLEWLETASVHAALLFYRDNLRVAFPHGLVAEETSSRLPLRRIFLAGAAACVLLLAAWFALEKRTNGRSAVRQNAAVLAQRHTVPQKQISADKIDPRPPAANAIVSAEPVFPDKRPQTTVAQHQNGTASGDFPAERKEEMNATLAAAATAALTVTGAFAVNNATGDAEGVSSLHFIDARFCVDTICNLNHFIDARPCADTGSAGRKKWIIDTAKPLGTVIMLM